MFANPPKNARVLFADMNAFFASCEQQVRPELRGQPVGVAPYTGQNGCIIAKSYEAKAWGVKTGLLVGEARRICPNLKIIESRPALYYFYHKEIVKVLGSINPIVKGLSIDEFALFLKGSDQMSGQAKQMAITIKSSIKREVGDWLRCSVGIGSNIFLAKMAAEFKKPDGLTEVTLEELPTFYRTLKDLKDLTGINTGMSRQLRRHNIQTPLHFYEATREDLRRWLGMIGLQWYFRLRGWEVDHNVHKSRMIGHQHVLAPEYRTHQRAYSVLVKLAHKAGQRLRAGGFFARGLSVSVHFLEGGGWSDHIRCELFQDQVTINRLVSQLYYGYQNSKSTAHPSMNSGCPEPVEGQIPHKFQNSNNPQSAFKTKRPIMVRVVLFDLERSTAQPISLFDNLERQRRLSVTLDTINDQFGPMTIHPASSLGTTTAAPDRIPFGEVRYGIRG